MKSTLFRYMQLEKTFLRLYEFWVKIYCNFCLSVVISVWNTKCTVWKHTFINDVCWSVGVVLITVSVCVCAGSSGGCEWSVWGADWSGEDREEDHASSSDSAEVWTLLRPVAGGHWISGTDHPSSSFSPLSLHLFNPAGFNVSCRWWSSPNPLSYFHPSAALTWRTGATDGRLNIHTRHTPLCFM